MIATDSFQVRPMQSQEIELALDWAAAEGWNPGLADAVCFATVDPEGFLLGEIAGAPVATLWVANYDEQFAFLGGYIVRPDLRGRGYGWRLWQAGIAHAGARTIGLDGVLAEQNNYKKMWIRACLSQRSLRRESNGRNAFRDRAPCIHSVSNDCRGRRQRIPGRSSGISPCLVQCARSCRPSAYP